MVHKHFVMNICITDSSRAVIWKLDGRLATTQQMRSSGVDLDWIEMDGFLTFAYITCNRPIQTARLHATWSLKSGSLHGNIANIAGLLPYIRWVRARLP